MVKTFVHSWLAPISMIAILSASGAAARAANTYYVSPSGSDSNAGTLASPWKTINHAAQIATAGATVNVRAGTYKEYVTVANSGNATSGYITFQNYGTEAAILDGTGVSCCGGNGSIRGLFNILSKSHVRVKGFELRNYKSTDNQNEPAGVYVVGSGSYVQILNNKVHDIGIASSVEANDGNAHGIGVYGQAKTPYSYVTISGNEVYNMKTGWSETITLDGNVTNFSVTGNVVHDNDNIGIDAAGFWGQGPKGHDQAMVGTISGNTVYNISSTTNGAYGGDANADGIYCDGCAQVIIERNLVHHCDLGVEAASEVKGQVSSYVTIRNNVVYDSAQVNVSIGGYASNVGGSDNVTVVNNTLYQSAAAAGNGFQIQYKATNNAFKNNIVYMANAGTNLYYYTSQSPAPVAMDYNVYYDSAVNATWVWKNKTYTGFGSFQSGSVQEAHGKYADPLFASVADHDFRVPSNSPAVGAGTNLGSSVVGTVDFAGSARVVNTIDAGAYER